MMSATGPELDGGSAYAVRPAPVGHGPREAVAIGLGACLYMPATRPSLVKSILTQARRGTRSIVVCLEDAVGHGRLAEAMGLVVAALAELADTDMTSRPLLFCRVAHPDHIRDISLADTGSMLSGFVLPKFTPADGSRWLEAVRQSSLEGGRNLWAMPVLETPDLLRSDTRTSWLLDLADVLAPHVDLVLGLRIGAVDLAGHLGLRRGSNDSVYDVGPLSAVVSDIVSVFAPRGDLVPAIAGPVWERYPPAASSLRAGILAGLDHAEAVARVPSLLTSAGLDGFLAELAGDKAHGLVGKSAIHPSQVPIIEAWQAVTFEDYGDAADVLRAEGASASPFGNKMNEERPHRRWAQRTLQRASVSGVLAPGATWRDVVAAWLAGTDVVW